MTIMNHRSSREAVADALEEHAQSLWGRERAEAIRGALQDMAGQLWQLAHNLPHREEEPAFFFNDRDPCLRHS